MKSEPHIGNKLRLAILLMMLIALIVALAQVFFKFASIPSIYPVYFIGAFCIGLILYFTTFFITVFSYRFGELSTLYPITSLSNVLYMLFAFLLFGEALTFWKIFSVLNIMIGIFMISGQTRKEG